MAELIGLRYIVLMDNLPEFESDFLTEISKSFLKIRKSLKYNSHKLSFHKVMDRANEKKMEKVELSILSSLSRNNIRIRLYAWDDRWIWIDARKSNREGWEWEYTLEGRLSGSTTERELMETLKSFNEVSIVFDKYNVSMEAHSHWTTLIATGPKQVSSP